MRMLHKANYGSSRELWQGLGQKELDIEEITNLFLTKYKKKAIYAKFEID